MLLLLRLESLITHMPSIPLLHLLDECLHVFGSIYQIDVPRLFSDPQNTQVNQGRVESAATRLLEMHLFVEYLWPDGVQC